jgi:DNA-binding CsgD family transcriptional regulator
VLLMITDTENDPGPATTLLRDAYGLTAREAAVALQTARGNGVDGVAKALGMTPKHGTIAS